MEQLVRIVASTLGFKTAHYHTSNTRFNSIPIPHRHAISNLPFPYSLSHRESKPTMAKSASSLLQKLKGFIKKPWEITGPVSHPEYKSALPGALEYRVYCPATEKERAIIPTSLPETVYDIKYYTRDQRRNRPPSVRTIFKKADIEKLRKEATYDVADFPPIYPNVAVEEDLDARGGGYQA